MPIETIFFDLGKVLIDFSFEKMCDNLSKLTGLSEEKILFEIFESGVGKAYEEGLLSSQDLHANLQKISPHSFSFEELMEAISNIFAPKEEMLIFVKTLKEKAFKLYLLSNTCEAHIQYIQKHFNFLPLFDGHVLSYKVGARKPDPKIFLAALKMSQSKPQNCFYTDDIAEYVDSAKEFGIDGHAFTDKADLAKALESRGVVVG